MQHPWRILRGKPHLTLAIEDLGDEGPHARIVGCTITLTRGLSQVERRCAVMHELIHDERGIPTGPDPGEELAVEREVARRLIPLEQLIWVAKLNLPLVDAAEELWVRPDLVELRVRSITHPAEVARWRAAAQEWA